MREISISRGRKVMKRILIFTWIVILAIGIQAQESESTEGDGNQKDGTAFDISGAASLMFGQVVSGYSYFRMGEKPISNQWQDFYKGQLFFSSDINQWLSAKIGLEVRSNFFLYSRDDDVTMKSYKKETYRNQYRPAIPSAEGIMHWKFNNQSSLFIETGLFQYNFNPEIKNLGNFLYRGTAFPLCLETKIDYPWYDMAGIRSEYTFLDNSVKLDLIVNTIINRAPFYDFSLGFTASYTLPDKMLDLGIGICFDRLLASDEDITSSKKLYNQPGFDSSWTLKSTKLDTRVTFDLKPLIGNPDILGKQDAKVYGEMAILGFKDPQYFPDSTFSSSLSHRMPILFGVNLPVFKILDLLSVEVEYFNSPYMNDWWGQYGTFPSPAPVFYSEMDSSWVDNYKNKDNLKWTVYVKKSFSKFDLIGIFANDHMFYESYTAESQSNTEQTLRKPKDWHWYIKLQYNL
jgi:hypothetical protein